MHSDDLKHKCPARRLRLVATRGFPLAPAAPRTETGRQREAGFLASGFYRFSSAFPGRETQWHVDETLAGYSCGGSHGFKPRSLTLRVGWS
jgi:hypothetical protein